MQGSDLCVVADIHVVHQVRIELPAISTMRSQRSPT